MGCPREIRSVFGGAICSSAPSRHHAATTSICAWWNPIARARRSSNALWFTSGARTSWLLISTPWCASCRAIPPPRAGFVARTSPHPRLPLGTPAGDPPPVGEVGAGPHAGCGRLPSPPRSAPLGAPLSFAGQSPHPSGQRACAGTLVGRVLRLYRARSSLETAVETLAPGASELRAIEAVVSNPGRSAGAESPPGKRALLGVAPPVQPATRLGVLRPHLHLF